MTDLAALSLLSVLGLFSLIGEEMVSKDKCVGSLVGLAIGDALGAPVEFMARGSFRPVTGYRSGGPFKLNAGDWTDDTSMALALADALIFAVGEFREEVILAHWLEWYRKGKYSVNGRCFDIGNQTRNALEYFQKNGKAVGPNEQALGNGGVMRLAPAAIVDAYRDSNSPTFSIRQSWLTHPSSEASEVATSLGTLLVSLLREQSIELSPLAKNTKAPVANGGKATDAYEMALWAFRNTDSFDACVLAAANLGGDSDSIGAVAGQIAGAHYGFSAMRSSPLVNELTDISMIMETASRLCEIACGKSR